MKLLLSLLCIHLIMACASYFIDKRFILEITMRFHLIPWFSLFNILIYYTLIGWKSLVVSYINLYSSLFPNYMNCVQIAPIETRCYLNVLTLEISINHIMVDSVLGSPWAVNFTKKFEFFLHKVTKGTESFPAIPSTSNSNTFVSENQLNVWKPVFIDFRCTFRRSF